jgi:predicted amidohydrolase YtcJ
MEKEKGSLTPGKLADCVVLSEDLIQTPPDKIKEIQVEMTIVGGNIVFSNRFDLQYESHILRISL